MIDFQLVLFCFRLIFQKFTWLLLRFLIYFRAWYFWVSVMFSAFLSAHWAIEKMDFHSWSCEKEQFFTVSSMLNWNKNYSKIFNFFYKIDMSLDSYGKSFSTNLQASRDPHKSVLWNNIEPGDPYDIRKYHPHLTQINDCSPSRRN